MFNALIEGLFIFKILWDIAWDIGKLIGRAVVGLISMAVSAIKSHN